MQSRISVFRAAALGTDDATAPDSIVDRYKIEELAFSGVPEQLRAVYWKILLNYLPPDRSSWPDFLATQRAAYRQWKAELFFDPAEGIPPLSGSVPEHEIDHPLSLGEQSRWSKYFKDGEILFEIDKDVKRTHQDLHFFSVEGENSNHMRSILFVYAKLNPGITYVQGMNELLAPILFTFCGEAGVSKEDAEADAFYCFTNLMAEVRDNFVRTLDGTVDGIMGTVRASNAILKQLDSDVWNDLEAKEIAPQYYSFRWLSLMLCQEFPLPEVCRLWDSFLADSRRFAFFRFFCAAMVVYQRDALLNLEYADSVKLLQHYPSVDVDRLVRFAKTLYDQSPLSPSAM